MTLSHTLKIIKELFIYVRAYIRSAHKKKTELTLFVMEIKLSGEFFSFSNKQNDTLTYFKNYKRIVYLCACIHKECAQKKLNLHFSLQK